MVICFISLSGLQLVTRFLFLFSLHASGESLFLTVIAMLFKTKYAEGFIYSSFIIMAAEIGSLIE